MRLAYPTQVKRAKPDNQSGLFYIIKYCQSYCGLRECLTNLVSGNLRPECINNIIYNNEIISVFVFYKKSAQEIIEQNNYTPSIT